MEERIKIPPDVQAAVLLNCARRCCLCFGLNADATLKKGQIAHLDQDRKANKVTNLVYLCFDHHDEFDSTTRQSKGLTKTEVAAYRQRLHEYVRTSLSPEATSKDFVVTSIEEQEVVLETMNRYWQAGHASPSTIAAEITLRMKLIRDYQRLLEKEERRIFRLPISDDADRVWQNTAKRLRKTLALPPGIWGLCPDGYIPTHLFREFNQLSAKWAKGSLSYFECGRLHWLLDEDLDFDQYFILYGLPHDTVGALGIAALDSFMFAFGMRKSTSI